MQILRQVDEEAALVAIQAPLGGTAGTSCFSALFDYVHIAAILMVGLDSW